MHNAILKRCTNPDTMLDGVNYFSCTFRIKNYMWTGNKSAYLMAYHKIKPVWSNGKIQFGLCLLSISVIRKPGNLRIYYRKSLNYDEYVFGNRKWKRIEVKQLTDRQINILILAKQGKTSKEIAEELSLSPNTVRNMETILYRKLGVHSISEAVTFTTNHQMLFLPETYQREREEIQYKEIPTKKNRRPLTKEIFLHIQQGLDNRQSVNSIAKYEGISESAIRYAIKKGKLHYERMVFAKNKMDG
jgi:DNA-binding CsgD family transcriptional regulator